MLIAQRSGLRVPPSLLLLDSDMGAIDAFVTDWSLPVMVRMDYSTLPRRKTLGGIPLYGLEAIKRISAFLFDQSCLPLFHPELARLENEFSVGILVSKNAKTAKLDIVGKGFDAGDLRLGWANPHQSFDVDLLNDNLTPLGRISDKDYRVERIQRLERRARLSRYADFANENGKLLHTLDGLKVTESEITKHEAAIPEAYGAIPLFHLKELAKIAGILSFEVVGQLPPSKEFVGSLSYLRGHGWLLWDIYGEWYKRG